MKEIIQETVKYLKEGKIILYPTDTIWGVGCDATNSRAVQKVYKLKQRDETKSLIILLDHIDKLPLYLKEVPQVAYDLINNIENPLTIIYQNAKGLAKNVIAKDKSIAIRIVKNDFCRELIKAFGKPIVSTSANLSDEPTPLFFNQISAEIKNSVDYVVDIDQHLINKVKPSTIIKLKVDGEFEIIRH